MDKSSNPIMELSKFLKSIDYDIIINNAGTLMEHIKEQTAKGSKGTPRIMLELYFVMMNEKTPKSNKLIISAALAYQLLPNDLLPKEDYGIVGYLDNATALYLAYRKVKKSVTPEIKEKVDEILESWTKSAKELQF